MNAPEARRHLEAIFKAALARVDPFQMIMDHVRLTGTILEIDVENVSKRIDLANYRQVFIIGAGKATAPMAMAFEQILGDRISKGLIVVKYGHTASLSRIELLEAGHPEPDENGVKASARIMEIAGEADGETLVITLISGGGSALLTLPMHMEADGESVTLTLAHKQDVTHALLGCGADITEINCIRKHLSGIKGGRLADQIIPGTNLSFILSDVVGDDLSSIASGPTVPDLTSFDDALAILENYKITTAIPAPVLRALELGSQKAISTSQEHENSVLKRSSNILIGTNRLAMSAAGAKAESLGYKVVFLTSRITGEAKEVAKFLAGIAADTAVSDMLAPKPVCIISGGEPVVTLQGAGKGGRNQEMALAFLGEIRRDPEFFNGVSFLAASTDGNDGPTDAAGAFASVEILQRAVSSGLAIDEYLKNNDSYHFFQRIHGLCKTGPTNTNVCDLHVILIGSPADFGYAY
ncbi:glycerate kinase type-2 family protein [Desulfobacula sp.]